MIDYYMYGQLVGLLTIKGDEINYLGDDALYRNNELTKVMVANLE
jgi:hypothetical protein